MIASYFQAILAADAPAPQQAPGQGLWMMLGPALLVFMLFFMMSSQKKRAKQQEQMIKSLKSLDKVSTTSGIIGTVVTVKDRSVSIRSEDSKFEVLKSAVTEVLERKADAAEAKGDQQEQWLKSLKAGDRVSTTAGIVGTILAVRDLSVTIRSEDSKLEVLKSAVTEVLERKGEPAEAKNRKPEPAEAKS